MATAMGVLLLGVPLVFAAIIGLLVWGFTRPGKPVQPLMGAGLPGGAPTPTAPGWPSGRWNARLTKPGGLALGARYGTITLWQGGLAFARDDAAQPEWLVPCTHVRVTRLGAFTMSGADVRLDGPFGSVDAIVSQEHINRLSDNDFKDRRERRYADEFAAMVVASGGVPG